VKKDFTQRRNERDGKKEEEFYPRMATNSHE
jgi:hypothetical protein